MTRYTVVWVRSARDELADLWVNALDRNAVTTAAQFSDRQLSEDAAGKGNELSEGLRAWYTPPLKAIFTVREDDRIVEVLRVHGV